MSNKEKRKLLEKKYYPLEWKIEDDEIKLWSLVTGEQLLEDHEVHKIERNFIEEQIMKDLCFSGQIEIM